LFDIVGLINTVGLAGVLFIIFAECGLFFGFFLPGDSLLFTAGFLASQGLMNIWVLTIGSFIMAFTGVIVGYYFGAKVGPKIFSREDSLLFHKDHIERARLFFEKHGGKTLILARFIPIVRTFVPIVAGVGKMRYSTFIIYNFIGALLWAVGATLLGYLLGNVVPHADKLILPIVLFIIVASVFPGIVSLLRNPASRARLWAMIRRKKENV
jgi:membrane-associated protein